MRVTLVAAVMLAGVTATQAAPFEIILHQKSREFRNTGTIILREPVTDRELGRYEFVSGGFGRGSAPFGHYEIGNYREDGWIGPRFEIHQTGINLFEGDSAWDPSRKIMRTWLQIHQMHGFGHIDGTLGCIGVYGSPKVWAEFIANVNYLRAWYGTVSFDLREAKDNVTAIAHR